MTKILAIGIIWSIAANSRTNGFIHSVTLVPIIVFRFQDKTTGATSKTRWLLSFVVNNTSVDRAN